MKLRVAKKVIKAWVSEWVFAGRPGGAFHSSIYKRTTTRVADSRVDLEYLTKVFSELPKKTV